MTPELLIGRSAEAAYLADLARSQVRDAPPLLAALGEVERTPYSLDPRDVHVTWAVVRHRGYAACAEAAAFLAAAAQREGRTVVLRLLGAPSRPGYAHAVVVVDGVTLDPYRAAALPGARHVLAEVAL